MVWVNCMAVECNAREGNCSDSIASARNAQPGAISLSVTYVGGTTVQLCSDYNIGMAAMVSVGII